jgi:hypothetical protein
MTRAGLRPTHVVEELMIVDEFWQLLETDLEAVQQPPPQTKRNGRIEVKLKLKYRKHAV